MSDEEITAALNTAGKSDQILQIVAFIVSFIFLMIYISFFCTLRRASMQKKVATNPWIMVLPTIYITCYTLRYLLKVINTSTDHMPVPFQILFDSCFVIGHALFYVIMLLRLSLGFKGTKYQTTPIKLLLCVIMIISITLINIFYYLIKRQRIGDETLIKGSSWKRFIQWNAQDIHNDLFIALVCCNLCFAVILIYLFVRNIALMIMAQMKHQSRRRR
eukprot:307415_1